MKKNKKFEIEPIVTMDTLNTDMMSLILGGIGTSDCTINCDVNIVVCGRDFDCGTNKQCTLSNPCKDCDLSVCSPFS